MFEGAQGALLDVDHGTYPYVTSSNTVAGAAAAGAGVAPQRLDYVLGITKAYATRVGSGPFPTELTDATGDHLRNRWQRVRLGHRPAARCGWFDAAALKRSVQFNGTTGLCITKLDVLDGLPTRDGSAPAIAWTAPRSTSCHSAPTRLSRCEPVYEDFAGWSESTFGVQRLECVAAAMRAAISSG